MAMEVRQQDAAQGGLGNVVRMDLGPVKLLTEESAFIKEETLATIIDPHNLNGAGLQDIYAQRADDFEEPEVLEIWYNRKEKKQVETVFEDTLLADQKPRILVSVKAVHSMHRAIAILTRKLDNALITLRSCRQAYFKELSHLRELINRDQRKERSLDHGDHDSFFFNPDSFQDEITVEFFRERLEEATNELKQKLLTKQAQITKLQQIINRRTTGFDVSDSVEYQEMVEKYNELYDDNEKLKEEFEREQDKIRFKEHEKEHLEGQLKDAEVLLKKQLDKTKTNLKKVEDAHTVIERQLRKERMTWFEKEKEYQEKVASLEAQLKEKEAMGLNSEALWRAQMAMETSPQATPRHHQHTPSSPSSPGQRQLQQSALSPAHQDHAGTVDLDDARYNFSVPSSVYDNAGEARKNSQEASAKKKRKKEGKKKHEKNTEKTPSVGATWDAPPSDASMDAQGLQPSAPQQPPKNPQSKRPSIGRHRTQSKLQAKGSVELDRSLHEIRENDGDGDGDGDVGGDGDGGGDVDVDREPSKDRSMREKMERKTMRAEKRAVRKERRDRKKALQDRASHGGTMFFRNPESADVKGSEDNLSQTWPTIISKEATADDADPEEGRSDVEQDPTELRAGEERDEQDYKKQAPAQPDKLEQTHQHVDDNVEEKQVHEIRQDEPRQQDTQEPEQRDVEINAHDCQDKPDHAQVPAQQEPHDTLVLPQEQQQVPQQEEQQDQQQGEQQQKQPERQKGRRKTKTKENQLRVSRRSRKTLSGPLEQGVQQQTQEEQQQGGQQQTQDEQQQGGQQQSQEEQQQGGQQHVQEEQQQGGQQQTQEDQQQGRQQLNHEQPQQPDDDSNDEDGEVDLDALMASWQMDMVRNSDTQEEQRDDHDDHDDQDNHDEHSDVEDGDPLDNFGNMPATRARFERQRLLATLSNAGPSVPSPRRRKILKHRHAQDFAKAAGEEASRAAIAAGKDPQAVAEAGKDAVMAAGGSLANAVKAAGNGAEQAAAAAGNSSEEVAENVKIATLAAGGSATDAAIAAGGAALRAATAAGKDPQTAAQACKDAVFAADGTHEDVVKAVGDAAEQAAIAESKSPEEIAQATREAIISAGVSPEEAAKAAGGAASRAAIAAGKDLQAAAQAGKDAVLAAGGSLADCAQAVKNAIADIIDSSANNVGEEVDGNSGNQLTRPANLKDSDTINMELGQVSDNRGHADAEASDVAVEQKSLPHTRSSRQSLAPQADDRGPAITQSKSEPGNSHKQLLDSDSSSLSESSAELSSGSSFGDSVAGESDEEEEREEEEEYQEQSPYHVNVLAESSNTAAPTSQIVQSHIDAIANTGIPSCFFAAKQLAGYLNEENLFRLQQELLKHKSFPRAQVSQGKDSGLKAQGLPIRTDFEDVDRLSTAASTDDLASIHSSRPVTVAEDDNRKQMAFEAGPMTVIQSKSGAGDYGLCVRTYTEPAGDSSSASDGDEVARGKSVKGIFRGRAPATRDTNTFVHQPTTDMDLRDAFTVKGAGPTPTATRSSSTTPRLSMPAEIEDDSPGHNGESRASTGTRLRAEANPDFELLGEQKLSPTRGSTSPMPIGDDRNTLHIPPPSPRTSMAPDSEDRDGQRLSGVLKIGGRPSNWKLLAARPSTTEGHQSEEDGAKEQKKKVGFDLNNKASKFGEITDLVIGTNPRSRRLVGFADDVETHEVVDSQNYASKRQVAVCDSSQQTLISVNQGERAESHFEILWDTGDAFKASAPKEQELLLTRVMDELARLCADIAAMTGVKGTKHGSTKKHEDSHAEVMASIDILRRQVSADPNANAPSSGPLLGLSSDDFLQSNSLDGKPGHASRKTHAARFWGKGHRGSAAGIGLGHHFGLEFDEDESMLGLKVTKAPRQSQYTKNKAGQAPVKLRSLMPADLMIMGKTGAHTEATHENQHEHKGAGWGAGQTSEALDLNRISSAATLSTAASISSLNLEDQFSMGASTLTGSGARSLLLKIGGRDHRHAKMHQHDIRVPHKPKTTGLVVGEGIVGSQVGAGANETVVLPEHARQDKNAGANPTRAPRKSLRTSIMHNRDSLQMPWQELSREGAALDWDEDQLDRLKITGKVPETKEIVDKSRKFLNSEYRKQGMEPLPPRTPEHHPSEGPPRGAYPLEGPQGAPRDEKWFPGESTRLSVVFRKAANASHMSNPAGSIGQILRMK